MAKPAVVKKITAFITTGSSLALLGSVGAAYIDPQTFILPAFLGLAFPFILILHVVICVVYLLICRSKLIFLFIVPLLASASTFCSFFGVHFSSVPVVKATNSIAFMTYNVHEFKDWNDRDILVNDEICKLIAEQNPDVACFQDFYSSKKNNNVDSLKKVLNTQYFYKGPDRKDLFPKNALAIFSKFPIVNTGYIYLTDKESGNQCIYTDVKMGDKIFRIYNVHLQSLKFGQEDFDRWDKGPAHKVSFLSANVRRLHYAFLERSNQVKIMKKELASCTIPYIVAGDFNDSPASYAVHEMSEGLTNAFRAKAKGYAVTYNGDLPDFQIDYILTNPSFKVLNYNVIKQKLSDHFPVRADISL